MRYLLIGLFTILSTFSFAQYKTYSNVGSGIMGQDFFGLEISEDWLGGYYTVTEDALNNISFVTRYNPNGSVSFSRSYAVGGTNVRITGVNVSMADSSVIIIGNATSGLGVSYLKIDSSGNELIYKEHTSSSYNNLNVYETHINSDGSVSAFGEVSQCPSTCQTFGAVWRFNATGDLVSFNTHGGTNLNVNVLRANQLSNGNYLVVEFSSNTITGDDARHLLLTNSSGAVLSQTAYDAAGSGLFAGFLTGTLHSNGSYYVGGNFVSTAPASNNGDYGFVMELNSSLVYQDHHVFQYASSGASVNTILEESNGDIGLYGSFFQGPFGDSDGMRVTFDPSTFSEESARAYGNGWSNDMYYIKRASDGGVLTYGSAYDNGNSVLRGEIVKLDSEGELGCNQMDVSTTSTTFPLALTSIPLTSQSATMNLSTPTLTGATYVVATSINCSSLSCAINVLYSKTDVDCNGNNTGAIDLTVTGVSGSETYAWTGPNGYTSSSDDITGLEAGVYNLTITDGSCSETTVATITEPTALGISLTQSHPSCNGANDGSINMTISGGTSSYTQNWTGPNSYSSSLEDINGLLAGTYNVTVNDANGCTETSSIVLTDPALLTVTVTGADVSCFGGSDGVATAVVTGGTANFSYLWNDGSAQTTVSASGLGAGSYSVDVTDANGCTASASGTVSEPAQITYNLTTTPSECNMSNGVASAGVMGGTAPYNYTWSSGGNASIESGLSPGMYTLDISDDNGCTVPQASFSIGDTTYGVDLCVIKVDTSSSMNVVVWEKPGPTGISGFNIYRDVVGTYTLIDFWPYDSLSEYVDSSAGINPNTTSYRYRVSVVDSCGGESVLSDFHETIHVQMNTGGGQANLLWDSYEGFSFGYYRIMKDTLGNNNWQVLDSVASTNFTYTDQHPGQNTRYRVDVVIPNQCTSTRANHNTTRSNKTQPANGGSQNGIAENEVSFVKLYPNPSNGTVNIVIDDGDRTTMTVYSAEGKLVKQEFITGSKSVVTLNVPNGLYTVIFDRDGLRDVKRLIIHR